MVLKNICYHSMLIESDTWHHCVQLCILMFRDQTFVSQVTGIYNALAIIEVFVTVLSFVFIK